MATAGHHPLRLPRILQVLLIVKKTTGGRAWLPKWGLTGLSPTQKANRRKNLAQEHNLLDALRQAAAREPVKQPHTPQAAGQKQH